MKAKIKNQKSKIKNTYQNSKIFKILEFGLPFCILIFAFWISSFAQEELSSKELLQKAWESHGEGKVEETFKYTQDCIDLYEEKALILQATLKSFPKAADIGAFSVLNDVATCYFIQAESLMRQGKINQAKSKFQYIIDSFSYAQAWDPRGWYWSVAEKAQESIKKLDEEKETKPLEPIKKLITTITLYDSGEEELVDYEKYGRFSNLGERDYRYEIVDQEGLSRATGEGIYPNTTSVRWDPNFRELMKAGRLKGNHWDFLHSEDLEAAFLKWATSPEPEGVKLYYTALILEKSGLIKHAIKAYYAILVHFPQAVGWTYWHTPWYVGQAAISKIYYLLRRHQLGWELRDAHIRVINGFDNDISNDIIIANPGKLIQLKSWEKIKKNLAEAKFLKRWMATGKIEKARIKKRLGEGKVRLIQYKDGGWHLLVDNKPFIIRGVTYAPSKVGQSPDEGTLGDWMYEDFNNNRRIDGPYDSFADKNHNNLQDLDETSIGDFQLMEEMGINCIRLYHYPHKINKELLNDLYKNFGIRVIMGDFLGKYALGSGASWYEGTDYTNLEHQKNMLDSVKKMVSEFKDEPYILFWLLGNENVYGVACNADKNPKAFFKFANEAAKLIKSMDSEHPVAIANGDTLYLDNFANFCADIDIFGCNSYRGDFGFGYLWQGVKEEVDKPAFITEYGCPAYAQGKSRDEAELLQAEYHRACWEDIIYNMADGSSLRPRGAGNALGGVIFEWLDEWWKAYEPAKHDWKGLFSGPFPDGYMHEEWLGLCSQGDGQQSPFLRQLRKVYYMYKEIWRQKGG